MDGRVVDVKGGWMWRESRFGGRVDVDVNTLFYYFCLKNDYIISFWMWMRGWWMWRDGGCGGRVDLEGGWMWRNRQSVECSISQYDHISVIFHCIAPIFCMHPYFLKI